MFGKIAAKGGCVLLFPERLKKNRPKAIISGPEKTRIGWGEDWIQFQIEAINLEVRKEGGSVATLENDLRCTVIAAAKVQIDVSKLTESLPKVVSQFFCSPTNDGNSVLNENFFKGPLTTKFNIVVERIVRTASYEKLLEEAAYHDGLRKQFELELDRQLKDGGFCLLSCDIRFTPVKPGDGVLAPEILRILEQWQDWEVAKERSNAEFKNKQATLADEASQKALERKAQSDDRHRQAQELEREKNMAFDEKMHAFDIQKANAEHKKEADLAEIRKKNKEFFHEIEEAAKAYEHEQDMKAKKSAQALQREDLAFANELQTRKAESEASILAQKIAAIAQEVELLNKSLEKAKREREIEGIKADTEAYAIEKKIGAEQSAQLEIAKTNRGLLEELIKQLPEIFKNLPREAGGEVTTINLGGAGSGEGTLNWQTVGLTLVQPLRKLLGGITASLDVPDSAAQAPSVASPRQSDDGSQPGS